MLIELEDFYLTLNLRFYSLEMFQNTGPAVYYTLAFSFLASFLYRLRKED